MVVHQSRSFRASGGCERLINPPCSVFARFTSWDLALEAIATKDIEEGEEILISCESAQF